MALPHVHTSSGSSRAGAAAATPDGVGLGCQGRLLRLGPVRRPLVDASVRGSCLCGSSRAYLAGGCWACYLASLHRFASMTDEVRRKPGMLMCVGRRRAATREEEEERGTGAEVGVVVAVRGDMVELELSLWVCVCMCVVCVCVCV